MLEESTTPDLVQLTRRMLDGASNRDFDAMLSLYAADAEWDGSRVAGEVMTTAGRHPRRMKSSSNLPQAPTCLRERAGFALRLEREQGFYTEAILISECHEGG